MHGIIVFYNLTGFLLVKESERVAYNNLLFIKCQTSKTEIYSKLTIKAPERRQWCAFSVNFKHISYIFFKLLYCSL